MQQNMAVTSHIFNPKRDHLVIVRASNFYQITLPNQSTYMVDLHRPSTFL